MFPITMSFTVANEAQLTKLVAATMPDGAGMLAPSPCQGHAKETEKAEAKKPAASAPTETAATPSTAQESVAATPKAETSDAKPGKTIDDAKALTMKIVADKGRDAAVALLKSYDVPVAAKLPAEKVAAFCADAEKVLAS